jgi:hypothetical protein
VALASLDNVPFARPWEVTKSAVIQDAYKKLVRGHSVFPVKAKSQNKTTILEP